MKRLTKTISVFCVIFLLAFGSLAATVCAESVSEPAPIDVVPESGVYYDAFNMFADFIYGPGATLTPDQNLVLTILSTLAVLFVVVVPFLVVFWVIRLFR